MLRNYMFSPVVFLCDGALSSPPGPQAGRKVSFIEPRSCRDMQIDAFQGSGTCCLQTQKSFPSRLALQHSVAETLCVRTTPARTSVDVHMDAGSAARTRVCGVACQDLFRLIALVDVHDISMIDCDSVHACRRVHEHLMGARPSHCSRSATARRVFICSTCLL